MTDKQRKFCREYLVDCNGTQAAIRAGYSKNSARQIADQLMSKLDIRKTIDEGLKKAEAERIADVTEIMQFLTKGIRQELEEEVITVQGVGDGLTEAIVKKKKIALKDAIKCAELLGKRYGIYTDKVEESVDMDININVDYGDAPEEDETE